MAAEFPSVGARARSGGMGGHHAPYRGATETWLTPPAIVRTLGPFDLDPCAAPEPRPWPTALRHIAWPEDGLFEEWTDRVWLNPPYGPKTGVWLARLANHGYGTALIFARTETKDWHKHVWPRATAILFLAGRLHFHFPDGRRAEANSGAPSALVAYGNLDADRLRMAQESGYLTGHLVRLRPELSPLPAANSQSAPSSSNSRTSAAPLNEETK